MSDDSTTGPYSVVRGKNNDLVGLVERHDLVIAELARSESADSGGAQGFDRTRITAWNAQLRKNMEWIHGQNGRVDLPHTYPTYYSIQYISNTLEVSVKSKGVRDLIRLYMQAMEQVSKSQSMGWSNGVDEHDYNRWILIMDKIDAFLTDYVDEVTPIDMPEYTSFSQEGSQEGSTSPFAANVSAEDRARLGPLAVPRQSLSVTV